MELRSTAHTHVGGMAKKIASCDFTEEMGDPTNKSQYGIEYFEYGPDPSLDDAESLVDEFISVLRRAKEAGAEGIVWRELPEISLYRDVKGAKVTCRVYARFHFLPNIGRLSAHRYDKRKT